MINFKLLPNEFYFENLARTYNQFHFPDETSFFDFWLGPQYKNRKIDFEVPINLGRFFDKWHFFQPEDLENVLAKHTLWPTLLPFYSSAQIKLQRKKILGLSNSSFHLPKWIKLKNEYFQYCPECFLESKKTNGVVTWNRLHQFPGIIVCEQHSKPLLMSNIAKNGNPQFMTAESADLSLSKARSISLSSRDREQLNRISSSVEWLLNSDYTQITLNDFITRLRVQFSIRGLASTNGYIRSEKFLAEFLNYYSPNLLQALNCYFEKTNNYQAWPLRALLKNPTGLHPLHFILIIIFLELSISEFLETPTKYEPFGSGPWPCLSFICKNYHDLVISDCKVNHRERSISIGTFRCDCGFCYQRIASEPDPEKQDIFFYSSIVERGNYWDRKFTDAWLNPNKTLLQICAEFNEGQTTLKKQAVRLDLPTSPAGSQASDLHHSEHPSLPSQKLTLQERQEIWLQAMEDNPTYSIRELCEAGFNPIYCYIKQNAKEWLDGNKPSPIKHKNWSSKLTNAAPGMYDIDLAEAILQTYQQVRTYKQKPEHKITKPYLHKITKHLKKYVLINQTSDSYSITFATASALGESLEEYYWHLFSWEICKHKIQVNNISNWRTWGHELGLGGLLGNSKWRDLFIKICSSTFPKFNYKSLVNSYYSSFRSDWTAYDIQLAKKVPEATKNIYETDGFPIKVTATSLGFHLNSLPEIIKQRHELPRTTSQIELHTETDEHFAIRVVKWSENFYSSFRFLPEPDKFIQDMNLAPYTDIPSVSHAITKALANLRSVYKPITAVYQIKELIRGVDFIQRDNMLAAEITEAIASIRAIIPPQQASEINIGRWLDEHRPLEWNKRTQITGKIHKYPKCKALLDQAYESHEDFRLREYAYRAMEYRKKCFQEWPEAEELFRRLAEAGLITNVREVDFTHANYDEYDKFLKGTVLLAYGYYIHLYPTNQLSKNKFKRKILCFHRLESLTDFVPEAFKILSSSESSEDWTKRKLIHYAKQFRKGESQETTSVDYICSYLLNGLTWIEVDDLLTDTMLDILPRYSKTLVGASDSSPFFPIHIMNDPLYKKFLPKSNALRKQLNP